MNDDFRQHDLHQLLRHHGLPRKLLITFFPMDARHDREYHPAGARTKTVLCLARTRMNDVISMGGTLIRLVEDGHRVHIAYMTSGNIAVFDHDALRVADLVLNTTDCSHRRAKIARG